MRYFQYSVSLEWVSMRNVVAGFSGKSLVLEFRQTIFPLIEVSGLEQHLIN